MFLIGPYQHYPCVVPHWTVLPRGHMITESVSSSHITVLQAPPPVAVVMMRYVSAVVWRQVATRPQVVVMVIDGIEAVGMETVGTAIWPPGLRLPVVVVGVVILLLLLR